MHSFDTEDSNSLHARSTDPITAQMAARSAESNRALNEEKVLEILRSCRHGLTARELSEFLEMDYVTVSPLLRPMARRGLIHEAGMKENDATGKKALVWKHGPSAGWVPGHSMPAMPRKQERDFRWFTADEILEMNRKGGREAEKFVQMLNSEIASRFVD